MALQDSVELTELIKLFPSEESAFTKGTVKGGSGMTLGENKPVAVGIFVILGVDVHYIEIKRNHRLGAGKRSARMTRACRGSHGDDVSSHLPCI